MRNQRGLDVSVLTWVQEALPTYEPPAGLMAASRESYLAVCERERARREERSSLIPDALAISSLLAFFGTVDLPEGVATFGEALLECSTDTAAGYPFRGLKRDVVTAFSRNTDAFLLWLESVRVSPLMWPSTHTETVKEELRGFESTGSLKDPHIIYGQDFVSLLMTKRRSMRVDNALYAAGRAGDTVFAPGMSMFYGAWDDLARYLCIGDENYLYWCSDWRKFNETMSSSTFAWIQYFREIFEKESMTPQEVHVAWSMQFTSVANRYNGTLEECRDMLMSGGARTTTDNTLHAIMLTISGLWESHRRHGLSLSCAEVLDAYRFKTYGDNLILRVPRDKSFIAVTLGAVWEEWGYAFTGGLRNWQQADFLSHTFERSDVLLCYIPVAVRWEKHLTSLCYPPAGVSDEAWVGRFASLRIMLASNCKADEVLKYVYVKWCQSRVGFLPGVVVAALHRIMTQPRTMVLMTFFGTALESEGLRGNIGPFNLQQIFIHVESEQKRQAYIDREARHLQEGEGGTACAVLARQVVGCGGESEHYATHQGHCGLHEGVSFGGCTAICAKGGEQGEDPLSPWQKVRSL